MTGEKPDHARNPAQDEPGALLQAHKPSGRLAGRVAFVTGIGSVGPGWGQREGHCRLVRPGGREGLRHRS